MEGNSPLEKTENPIKICVYEKHNVYTWSEVPKEAVATIIPNSIGVPSAIAITPEAFEILKSRPDFLERIYKHELEHDMAEKLAKPEIHPKHGLDNDILEFLKNHGYDFGDFKL